MSTVQPSGTITNPAGTSIYGAAYGVEFTGSPASVINAGSIAAAPQYAYAVWLQAGGYVSNASTGTITGGSGIYVGGAAGTVINAGTIASTGVGGSIVQTSGVVLQSGGTVSNASAGVITAAAIGVIAYNDGTVINAGGITGTNRYGVLLSGGGTVTNASGGTITGNNYAIDVVGSGGTVVNAGYIAGNANGVYLHAGGTVSNVYSGTITGSTGIFVLGAALTISNAGVITGGNGDGVEAAYGGSFSNASGGTITGQGDGVYVGNGTVTNAGIITGSGRYGVNGFGEAVSNASGGTITGLDAGVNAAGGSTVINAGSIAGATDAVAFGAGYTDLLVIDPGAAFSGTVIGGNAAGAGFISTLELASGAGAGTLTGLGTQYIQFAQTMIDANASWTLTSANTVAAGYTLTNSGTLVDTGTLTNAGYLAGSGTIVIGLASSLVDTGTVASAATIAFAGTSGALDLTPVGFGAVIGHFQAGDTISLTGVDNVSSDSIINNNTLDLVLSDSSHIDLTLDRDYVTADFATAAAGANTDITTDVVLCFVGGTLLDTQHGPVAVEALSVGDMMMTISGAARPITWIGQGHVLATRGRRGPATPVIVCKGALADNVPHHDLRVTKGHSLYLDGVLIPVECLVNHRSIIWDDRAQEVDLFHIELDRHDVLLANGAPAESYRDDGNRWLFQNANEGWAQPPPPPYAPVLTGGPVVDAVWRRLLDRSGARASQKLTNRTDLHLMADGIRLDATQSDADVCVFTLATMPAELRIVSRAGSPQELGLARDPRSLGVALRRITLRRGARFQVIEASDAHLDDTFHAFEPDNGFRWTDGDARLPMGLPGESGGPVELILHLGCTAQYVDDGAVRLAA